MKINDLKAERDHLLRCNDDIIKKAEKDDGRILTQEEQREMDNNLQEAERIKGQIETCRRSEELIKATAQATQTYREEERSTAPIQATNGGQAEDRTPRIEFPRCGNLRSFTGPNAQRDAYHAGQWYLATFAKNPTAVRYCRDSGMSEHIRAANEGTGSAGGFLVPDELSQAIINNQERYGVLRRVMRPFPMGSETAGIPRKIGGLTAYFGSEAAAMTESQAEWDKVNLVAKKLHVYTKYSTELDEDSIVSIMDILVDEIAQALAEKEDNAGFNGDGTSTYDGITGIVTKLTAATTSLSYVDAATGHDTYAEFDVADIQRLMGALPEYAEPGAAFYCSKMFREMVFGQLIATAGGNNKSDMNGPWQYSYLGFPIYTSQVLHKTPDTTNNAVVCMFGDLNKATTFGIRRDIRLSQSEHVAFSTDEIALKATERFDFVAHSIGDSTAAGPVVALIGKTS